jgi:hypothetical protein
MKYKECGTKGSEVKSRIWDSLKDLILTISAPLSSRKTRFL